MEESPAFFAWVLDRANNMRNNEEKEKFDAKQHAEQQRKMREYEEKQRQHAKQQRCD